MNSISFFSFECICVCMLHFAIKNTFSQMEMLLDQMEKIFNGPHKLSGNTTKCEQQQQKNKQRTHIEIRNKKQLHFISVGY